MTTEMGFDCCYVNSLLLAERRHGESASNYSGKSMTYSHLWTNSNDIPCPNVNLSKVMK